MIQIFVDTYLMVYYTNVAGISAAMVEIYATAVGNEEYAHILGLSQMAASMEGIKGVIIDDSTCPLY